MERILALDIGGTAIKAALFSENNAVLWKEEAPSHGRQGAARMLSAVESLISRCPHSYAAMGVSTTGQVDSHAGRIVFASDNVPGYTGVELRAWLMERFHVPVAVENDVNAAALGEAYFGAGRGEKDFLCLTYGTGVGGAIIMNDEIYSGARGIAGEFGHMIIHPDGLPCTCGLRGCYEQYASAGALVRAAAAMCPKVTSGRALFRLMKRNAALQDVVNQWVEEVLHGIASLVHIFNPSLIVLGGGVMGQQYVLNRLNLRFRDHVMDSFSDVRLVQAQLLNMAGAHGALMLARKALMMEEGLERAD